MSEQPNPFYAELESLGHVLKRDEDGEVDAWVVSEGFHNGPGCERCHDSWCEHCPNPKLERCDGGASHAAYVARRDRAEWDRLIQQYGPNGPDAQVPA